MIQIEAVRITQLRGIRELKLTPGRKSFVVSGPNGSGKSGVVDAIQFGLTGEISRLSGTGTGGLTVQKHGPHVDRRDDPASAEVSLTLYFPELGKSAILTRNIKTAKTFTLDPDVASVRAELKEVARHPELTLSRREIIKYILVEAGERSKEIQSLLKLEMIGNIRRVLATAKNKGVAEHTTAQKDTTNAKDALRRHLDVKILSAEDVLAAVNSRRQILGLPEIIELTADKVLNGGTTKGESHLAFNKVTAVRDLAAVKDAQAEFAHLGASETAAVLTDLAVLEGDPALLEAVKQRSFVERGLALVDGPRCPLCDQEWDEDHLKSHLKTKLVKSEKAEALQERLLENAGAIVAHARRIAVLLATIQGVADSDGPAGFSVELSQWAENLTTFAESSSTIEGVFGHKTRLEQGWVAAPPCLAENLKTLVMAVNAKPDQSSSGAAHGFLTLAQDRLNTYQQAKRAEKRAKDVAEIGKLVYTTYCDVAAEQLSALYEAVEGDFSDFYREINGDDEGAFKAKFEPAESKLDLEVSFYDKGMYPPRCLPQRGSPGRHGGLPLPRADEAPSW